MAWAVFLGFYFSFGCVGAVCSWIRLKFREMVFNRMMIYEYTPCLLQMVF